MKSTIRIGPIDVAHDLDVLGISYDILKQAIIAGEWERNKCTRLDAPNVPGFVSWAKTLRRLKELLIPHNWTPSDYTIVRPDGRMAMTVASGDEATGDNGSTPKTRHPKGPVTETAVVQNHEQLELFERVWKGGSILDGPRNGQVQTWMLVRRRIEETVNCELSLPSKLGEDGRVVDWGFRIILSPVVLEPPPINSDEDDGAASVEVKINRK
jgi:hypothetical protein